MAAYGKFRPIKKAKHRKPKPRYVSFRLGEQGWNVPRPQWNPSSRQLKALALVFIVIAGVLGTDQVAKVLFPNSPLNPIAPYDPFTLLWNGTVTGAGSNPQGAQTTIVAQNTGGSSMGLNPAGPGGNNPGGPNQRWGQCILAGNGQTVSQFQFSMKKIGSPTSTISALIGATTFDGAGRFCTGFSNPATLSTTSFDASTLSTSYTYQNFTFATPFSMTAGTYYTMEVRWDVGNCAACTTQSNTVNVEIASVAPVSGARESGYMSQNGAPMCANPTFVGGSDANCPTTYDLRFNVFSALACAAGYSCSNSGIDTSNLFSLKANATFPGVAITKAPIDVSTSSAKELLFYETWHNTTNIVAQPWAWFLTTNKTLATQAGYNPLTDSNVVFADIVYPTAGASNVKNYYEYQAKTGSQSQNNQGSLSSQSGLATNPYPSCPQTATLYICDSGTAVYSSQFQGIASVLNYTGNGGSSGSSQAFSLFCVDGTPGAGSPTTNAYCSSSTQTPTVTPCTGTSQEICATPTLPFFNMQSGPYFLGFWSSAGQTGTIQFGTSNTGTADARANSVWFWVPNPTVATPATPDTGSFFGPLIKALLGIGVWIFANIISFIVFLSNVVAPFLAATLSVLVGVLQAELNALGSFFGWGNIGDQFITFASGVITYFTTGLGDALTWLVRLISRGIDLIKIANFWVGFYLTGVLNVLADALNVISFIVRIGTTITTFLGSSYVLIMVVFFLWYDADMGLAGWHAWFETVKWITFISFDFLERMINFGISSVTWIIGRIPTFDGTTLPELPTIAIGGGPIFPSTDMTALREGNVFSVFGQMIGVVFLVWFESSGLPGSIGANVPSAPVANVAPFVTMLLIMVAIMGLVFVVSIPSNMVRGTFGLNELPGQTVSRFKGGVISSGQGVSGRVVRRHPERKFNVVVNRGLGVRGLRPVLRKPKNPISGPSTQGVG